MNLKVVDRGEYLFRVSQLLRALRLFTSGVRGVDLLVGSAALLFFSSKAIWVISKDSPFCSSETLTHLT